MCRSSGRVGQIILMPTLTFILILVNHKEVLLINCSNSDSDSDDLFYDITPELT